jgi:hypothetical protein
MAQQPQPSQPRPLTIVGRTLLGAYMVAATVLLVYLLIQLWPA